MQPVSSPKLKIDYDPESDTLWLGNGLPTPNGEDISDAVVVFFDDADRPNAVTIDHAAELLLPILTAARPAAKGNKSGKKAEPTDRIIQVTGLQCSARNTFR